VLKTLALFFLTLALACSKKPQVVDPPHHGPVTVRGSSNRSKFVIRCEVARTEAERARGLMYRQELGVDRGMFFIFDKQEVQSFWMKNTLIPLDMVFIDQDLRVVGIIENAMPRTETARRVTSPARYVLEVNAGIASSYGIAVGAQLQVDGLRRAP
jgi:uncharacterized membrane protein (UPF0127 family)